MPGKEKLSPIPRRVKKKDRMETAPMQSAASPSPIEAGGEKTETEKKRENPFLPKETPTAREYLLLV